MRKNHIVFIKNHIHSTTGATKALADIANELTQAGRQVTIFYFEGADVPFYSFHKAVSIIKIDIPKYILLDKVPVLRNWKKNRYIKYHLKKTRPDVVIAFSYVFDVIKACKTITTKVIAAERSSLKNPNNTKQLIAQRKYWYQLADAVTSNSQTTTKDLQQLADPKKVFYTPNPFILINEPIGKDSRKNYILAIGRLVSHKGYDTLLKSVKLLGLAMHGWKLRIIGDGPQEFELKTLARELGIVKYVDWVGVCPRPSKYFIESSIFVLSSRFEGVPNAVLDAMKYRMPIIISAVPGSMELILNEKNGLVVPIDDAEALAGALQRLIANDELRAKLGHEAFKSAQDAAERNTIKVWEEVIDSI